MLLFAALILDHYALISDLAGFRGPAAMDGSLIPSSPVSMRPA